MFEAINNISQFFKKKTVFFYADKLDYDYDNRIDQEKTNVKVTSNEKELINSLKNQMQQSQIIE